MTKIFAAVITIMIISASAANAAGMVDSALKLQALKTAMSKMPKAVQAMIIAKARAQARAQACPARFIRGNDGKCHPLFH